MGLLVVFVKQSKKKIAELSKPFLRAFASQYKLRFTEHYFHTWNTD